MYSFIIFCLLPIFMIISDCNQTHLSNECSTINYTNTCNDITNNNEDYNKLIKYVTSYKFRWEVAIFFSSLMLIKLFLEQYMNNDDLTFIVPLMYCMMYLGYLHVQLVKLNYV